MTAYQVAIFMINRSIELAKERNEAYYLDDIKLHKLLYFAQCYSLAKYDRVLFYDNIRKHKCGPYIESLDRFISEYGTGKYKNRLNSDYSPTSREWESLNTVLDTFGGTDAAELVRQTQESSPFQCSEDYRVISIDEMRKYGKLLFEINPSDPNTLTALSTKEYIDALQRTSKSLRKAQKRWNQIAASAHRTETQRAYK